MNFSTQRLLIRAFKLEDEKDFYDLMGNPNVVNPIPAKLLNREESNHKLREIIEGLDKTRVIRAIRLKESNELIGLCGILTNDENKPELAYRLREKFWRNGYAQETTRGLIEYCFDVLDYELVTADVTITNVNSSKILDKYLNVVREFYCEKDGTMDRRYHLTKEEWLERKS